MSLKEIAASTTAIGRRSLRLARDYMVESYNAVAVYGDTVRSSFKIDSSIHQDLPCSSVIMNAYQSLVLGNVSRFRNEVREFVLKHNEESFQSDETQAEFKLILDKWDIILTALGGRPPQQNNDTTEQQAASQG